jgi:hypothetical protein
MGRQGILNQRIDWPGPPAPQSSDLHRAAELAERNRKHRLAYSVRRAGLWSVRDAWPELRREERP